MWMSPIVAGSKYKYDGDNEYSDDDDETMMMTMMLREEKKQLPIEGWPDHFATATQTVKSQLFSLLNSLKSFVHPFNEETMNMI